MKIKSPLFRKTDLLIVAVLLLIAAVIWFWPKSAKTTQAVIRLNGQPVRTLRLDQDQAIQLQNNGYTLTVTVKNRQVQVTQSDCPDGICRNTSPITKAGQTIVCLPAACSVTVEGMPAVDGITY